MPTVDEGAVLPHTPTEVLSDAEGSSQVASVCPGVPGGSEIAGEREAMAVGPCTAMQAAGADAGAPACSGASGATANVADAGNIGATFAVSGAPAQEWGDLGHARHPDVVAFNNALWACLGDPTEALAAVGGG